MTRNTFVLESMDLNDAIARIDEVCDSANRRLSSGFHSIGKVCIREHIDGYEWDDPFARLGKLTLTDNKATPALYVEVRLLSATATAIVSDALRQQLPIVPEAILQEQAERAGPGRSGALARLAIGETRDHDPRTEGILADALRGDSFDERRGALEGMYLLRWPSFLGALRTALEVEREPAMRRAIQATIERCALVGEGT